VRATSVGLFVVFGAVGFATGGALGGFSMLSPVPLPVSILLAGAVGGASLGLASKDWKRVVLLALLGALGLTVGVLATLTFASFFNYSSALMGALAGVVVGASLGAAFGDWRTIVILAGVGGVGFGVGLFAGDSLRYALPVVRGAGSIVVAGTVGGASLGAALGYLEKRRLAGEPRAA
jgi:hypothetical protein